VESQKTLVTKVVGHGKMRIYAKNGVNIQKFAMEVAQTKVNWVESQVKSSLVPFFLKSFSMNSWYGMFGIFPSHYITYHDSMRWLLFYFYFFSNFVCLHFKSRSNSRCPPCVLGGWCTQVWDGFWGSTPLGNLHVFSLKFFEV
jgi:hypothetical protein